MLREEAAWRFKERHLRIPDDEYLDAMRGGVKLAHARGVTCVHDKDGWLGAAGLWQRLDEHGGLMLRVWQSVPHETLPVAPRACRSAAASARRCCASAT